MTQFRQSGFQQIPLIVKNLLIINILVFLIQQACESRGVVINGFSFDDLFALHYWQSPKFRWWQVLTHMFMHANLMHIFFNMFALWMFGRILEGVLGAQRFLIFYLICGLGGAFCHLGVLTFEYAGFHNAFIQYQEHPGLPAFIEFTKQYHVGVDPASMSAWYSDPGSIMEIRDSIRFLHEHYMHMIDVSMQGASGAVMGVLFGFGYLFPNTELYIYFIPIPIKAKWVVGVYALIELTQGVYNSAGDNIAHFAHLGGMLFAFILLRIWKNKLRNRYY